MHSPSGMRRLLPLALLGACTVDRIWDEPELDASDAAIAFYTQAGTRPGRVRSAGDVDGDGVQDVLIEVVDLDDGAHVGWDLHRLVGDRAIRGSEDAHVQFRGWFPSVGRAADLDRDGRSDLVFSSTTEGQVFTGAALLTPGIRTVEDATHRVIPQKNRLLYGVSTARHRDEVHELVAFEWYQPAQVTECHWSCETTNVPGGLVVHAFHEAIALDGPRIKLSADSARAHAEMTTDPGLEWFEAANSGEIDPSFVFLDRDWQFWVTHDGDGWVAEPQKFEWKTKRLVDVGTLALADTQVTWAATRGMREEDPRNWDTELLASMERPEGDRWLVARLPDRDLGVFHRDRALPLWSLPEQGLRHRFVGFGRDADPSGVLDLDGDGVGDLAITDPDSALAHLFQTTLGGDR